MSENPQVGTITHFFGKLRVATVRLEAPVQLGDRLRIRGHGRDFAVRVKSMQVNHKPVERAAPGQEVGILLGKKAHEGDMVLREERKGWLARLLGS